MSFSSPSHTSWFEKLLGFPETSAAEIHQQLALQGEYLFSKANGKQYRFGRLEIPSLATLRQQAPQPQHYQSKLHLAEVVGDVQALHQAPQHANAVFQAASQFNLLEMIGPEVSPEQGISGYEHDKTQGPACAIACGAGTMYRNYFVPLGDQIGQSSTRQVDGLDEIGKALGNENQRLWRMQNGYALASTASLKIISEHIANLSPQAYEELKSKLKIGIQWDTEVTLGDAAHSVTQVYCSALPVAYSEIGPAHWETFARLVLEATYEATFYAALQNYELHGNPELFLTLVGGGAFGNENGWILDAITLALKKFAGTPLQVKIVSYGQSKGFVREFVSNQQA